LRMRLFIADLCWMRSRSDASTVWSRIAQGLLASISHCLLRILVRHSRVIIPVVTGAPIVVQSLLPSSLQDLVDEAKALKDAHTTSFHIDPAIAAPHKHCPARHIKVPLHDITRATCPNGHDCARCTITSFILSTSKVRTCITCGWKALLPFAASDEGQLPVAAQSWIVRDLLEAVQRCLFCGNGFVEI
ncbi:putative zinc-finger of transcription factor IIIC complex-domain-containing protein, partial [Suillus paluster]|uniref:putative zinc-finger of transcription factor IIIC complex-domain-containing protein n=1 Tax=Suillus paluster TaxID=48578 RepID=UPI001B883620